TDLRPDQRWRGSTRRRYSGGTWQLGESRLPSITPTALNQSQLAWSPPNLGPDQFTLSFEVPGKLRTLFLADPVVWVPHQPPPLGTREGELIRSWLAVSDGTFFWDPGLRPRGRVSQHVQAYRISEEPDLSPPFRLADPNP